MTDLTPRLKAFSYNFDTALPFTPFELFPCVCYLIRENGGVIRRDSVKDYLNQISIATRRTPTRASLSEMMKVAYSQNVLLTNEPAVNGKPHNKSIDSRISVAYVSPPVLYTIGEKDEALVDEAAQYWSDNFHIQ